MDYIPIFLLLTFSVFCLLSAEAKVFMILMNEEPVSLFKSEYFSDRAEGRIAMHKERLINSHDKFLESLLRKGTYTKLYSYTHLLNGFAVHVESDEVLNLLKDAEGARAVHEDVKMEKLTTHTPKFLGIPNGVWPTLGGAPNSGEGVVVGLIDTGINPDHPSFWSPSPSGFVNQTKFNGTCASGEHFPSTACNGKIVGARYFARAAIVSGDFSSTRDYASPFDVDGHGSHTSSTAAGNYHIPVIVNGFNYGYASGMAPGASIAVYKALYDFGGYMSDAIAAVDQAVEDGVDVLSLSVGPATVPPGPSAFLNVLEMALLFATRAGVFVVQAAGNGGPSSSSILSFSPWIASVAASITDRKYNNSLVLGNGQSFSGSGLAPPTAGVHPLRIAAAADVSHMNTTSVVEIESCQHPEYFITSLARGKLIICTYTFDFEYEAASIAAVANTMQQVGAAGFIVTIDPDIGSEQVKGTTMTFPIAAIILNNMRASSALWEYYNANTARSNSGRAIRFDATARILDGRIASFSGLAPVVASYSSRGPDVNNALLQTADVLKPNIMAPGSSIWAAWSPSSQGDPYIKGQNFALAVGTSMAAPHVAGIAALIKHKHRKWGPAAILSALMTTADSTDHSGSPILAQSNNLLAPATPFDFGSGFVNPARALDPGVIFNVGFKDYVGFLCSVPGVDDDSVRQATGLGCPTKRKAWCSDLNTPSVTVSNLVGSRRVVRRLTNVSGKSEVYKVTVKQPLGVNVTVSPDAFKIRGNGSRHLLILLKATQATGNYTFGEMVLQGSRKHVVRVPIAVYVSTSL